jgi:hypothetical protein
VVSTFPAEPAGVVLEHAVGECAPDVDGKARPAHHAHLLSPARVARKMDAVRCSMYGSVADRRDIRDETRRNGGSATQRMF